jgi:hypothetical protein
MRSILVSDRNGFHFKYKVDRVSLRETIGGWAVDIVVEDREAPRKERIFKTFEDVRQDMPAPMDKRMWKWALIKRIRSIWNGPMMEVGLCHTRKKYNY